MFWFQVQVDPIQSYLNLKIGPTPGTKSGVFRYYFLRFSSRLFSILEGDRVYTKFLELLIPSAKSCFILNLKLPIMMVWPTNSFVWKNLAVFNEALFCCCCCCCCCWCCDGWVCVCDGPNIPPKADLKKSVIFLTFNLTLSLF